MTYSIVARDFETGVLGVAVASRFFAVGSLVPHISHNAAIATQAFVNPMWGVEGLPRLRAGESAETVITDFAVRDNGAAIRQAHMIDAQGNSAAHTGEGCIDWAGHLIADSVSVAGNMLAGPGVVADTLQSFQDNAALPFVERLLVAMEAGEAAGGDKRGKQAAAIRIHAGQDYPRYDLRVDDHANPLVELRRLLAVTEERAIHFAMTMATAENFSGTTDRTELDAAIARADAARKAAGETSPSFATLLD